MPERNDLDASMSKTTISPIYVSPKLLTLEYQVPNSSWLVVAQMRANCHAMRLYKCAATSVSINRLRERYIFTVQ
jgi:hypothetical protein